MLSKFFISRPIFATVLSIVIVTMGVAALVTLPIAQYPDLAPPTIAVSATYPGADASVVADTVAAPIEQEVNGVEGMLYMSSVSAADGSYTLTVTFAPGTNLDIASVQVQNRVAAATPKLPEEVRRLGIKTNKKMPDFAQMVSVSSPTGAHDDIFLSNFATLQLRDQIKRIDGVGDATVFGAAEYSMRLWLDPAKLEARGVTTAEVVAAIREQNVQVAAGKIGDEPAPAGTAFQYSISAKGRLVGVEEFEQIVVRVGDDGRVLRVTDLARVELGAQSYVLGSTLNGSAAANIAVYQLPGANLISISDQVAALIASIQPTLPDGLQVQVSYDAANVVRASIEEIVITLFVAALLVILTVLIFLQDFRATLIPAATIPVSLIGTFAVMATLGFSLNTLSLFGIVLAIGIVVDDAIVVVENVARNIENGLRGREAAIKAMQEVTGPVIATTLVLLAVFVPTSFMPGLVGEMYRQFGLTISAATVFSSINALTLSPALCALLMRPATGRKNLLFRGFERAIDWSTRRYTGVVGFAVRKLILSLALFLGVTAAGAFTYAQLPTGFVPQEDMGYFIAVAQLPDAASQQRTRAVADRVDAVLADTPGIASSIRIQGYSLIDGAANPSVASYIVVTDPWHERTTPQTSLRGMLRSVMGRFREIPDARIFAFPVPSIPGVGLVSGFDMQLQDRGGNGIEALGVAADALAEAANNQPAIEGASSGLRAGVPQLFVDVNRDKVKQMGLSLQTVFDALQTYLGSSYANDFNRFSRTYQVRVQAESAARATPDDILRLRIRNPAGQIVPLAALASVELRHGPATIVRHNLYPAASIKGRSAAGFSSGDALASMEETLANTLPGGAYGVAWSGLSYQEKAASGGAGAIFLLAIFLVFLVLAAQYESWSLPIAILLAVPLGLLGAALGTMVTPFGNNVYTQIGLVLLIALIAKNAILIVEFAREKRDAGLAVVDAAIEAARLRFRPILMTAISFVFGTLPLVVASGAGAGARVALGVSVFFGMILATLLGVILTPALYRLVQGLAERGRGGAHKQSR
ncbi:MAG: multidrug efflux RND transporter permease subunit [Planctomycetes bacterium]|nr:multidrug efflux RND transporter permease subunit [Planctomycetota bacterium]